MNKKPGLNVLRVCIVLILVLVVMYSGLQILESTVLFQQADQVQTTGKTITRDGVQYYPRQDITLVLIIGVDQQGKVVETGYNHGGAVEMATLLIFDEKTEECSILILNRDMMVTMPELNAYGKEIGTYYGQLAYSHTFGDGMEKSCENVRKTVSDLFYGISIDYYFSMNMSAIPVLNDAVGGVTVTVVDDFSQVDPSLSVGEITLLGDQAVTYVQTRWNVGDQLNLTRMERHKEYMKNFVSALRSKIRTAPGFVVDLYGEVEGYFVTDCSISALGRLAKDYGNYPVGRAITIAGENVLGEEYYEFYPDEEALDELILELFYAPKK